MITLEIITIGKNKMFNRSGMVYQDRVVVLELEIALCDAVDWVKNYYKNNDKENEATRKINFLTGCYQKFFDNDIEEVVRELARHVWTRK